MSGEPRPARDLPGWGSVAATLRGGTIVAVLAIALGLVWALVAETSAPTNLSAVELIAAGGPDALLAIGLLALTLVPIATLAAAASVFAQSRERRGLFVAVAVLALLVASLLVSAVLAAPA